MCDYYDYCDNRPHYVDYDEPGDLDGCPDVYGFVEPDDYELYHDLHGLDDCWVYCVSRGDAGVMPYWTGVEECDVYEGDVVLTWTGSDEPVSSVVCASRPDELVNGVTPCWTDVEECVICEDDVAMPRTGAGSDEPVASVVRTTGSDEPVDSVVHPTRSDEPVGRVAVTSSADTVSVVTTGVAFQEQCDVPSGSVCDYDDDFYYGHYDENPDYLDYDDPDDFDSYPDVYGFIEPDDYELYHDLHGPGGCGEYCISRSEAGVTPYWTGIEKCDECCPAPDRVRCW